MAHKLTVAYQGEAGSVLKTAQKMMVDLGFEVSKIGAGEVRGTRNHSLVSGKKTNVMIELVSELIIRASSGHLSAEAELGTMRKHIASIVVPFVTMEALILFLVFFMDDMRMVKVSLLTAGTWIVIGPAMLFGFRRLALREIEKFIHNAATIGSEG